MKKFVYIVFFFSLLVFLISLSLRILNRDQKLYSEFVNAMNLNDSQKIDSFLVSISNVSLDKYNFFKGIRCFWEGDFEEGFFILSSLLSNRSLSSKEVSIAKFLVGYYLLFEKNDSKGISFLTSEPYTFFPEFVSYVIGVYNFNKGNYDEAIEFFYSSTNIPNENVRKDVISRILFIEISKYGEAGKDIKGISYKFEFTNVLEKILKSY